MDPAAALFVLIMVFILASRILRLESKVEKLEAVSKPSQTTEAHND